MFGRTILRILLLLLIALSIPTLWMGAASAQQHLYFSDAFTTTIYRSDLDGSNQIPIIVDPSTLPANLAIDDVHQTLYWGDSENSTINRANLDGTSPAVVVDSSNSIYHITVDPLAGKVYWTDGQGIKRINFDSTGEEYYLLAQEDFIIGVGFDAVRNFIVWSTGFGEIFGAPTFNSQQSEFYGTTTHIEGLSVDPVGGFAYLAVLIDGRIDRASFFGPPPEPIVDGGIQSAPYSVALDFPTTRVFWADLGFSSIMYADLNARQPIELIPGILPTGLAIDCGFLAPDSDGDDARDCNESCPSDPLKTTPGECGCGFLDTDSDSDGIADCNDSCPNDGSKQDPGSCGCGVTDTDSDLDGSADCIDQCDADNAKQLPGACGCGIADTDSDLDGFTDCLEECPTDSTKQVAGICGCGVSDADSDSDEFADCVDACPLNNFKLLPGTCGCSMADSDSDLDGLPDCFDVCLSDACADLRILSPTTELVDPPVVEVFGRKVVITFETFADITTEVETPSDIGEGPKTIAAGKRNRGQLSARYIIILKRERRSPQDSSEGGSKSQDTIRASSKRSEYTFRDLAPGNYSVRYRAQIVKADKVVARTNISPAAFFTIVKG